MITIFVLVRLIIGCTLMVLLYFVGKARGFREGARDVSMRQPANLGCIQVFYHGSSAEIAMLTPQPSRLTQEPVVFGTPSYTDALIFSGQWTDYDFAVWGDGKKRYIEEQYPCAFAKLNRIGYIHHMQSTDAAPFKPLGSGLSGEHVCTEAVAPFRVDKMNVYSYLTDVVVESERTMVAEFSHHRELPLVMRTHAEAVAARKTAEPIVIEGNILCHVVPADLSDASIAELCANRGIRTWRINRDNIDGADLSEPCVMIGNPMSGNARYEFSCPHVYQRVDFNALVASFSNKKTTVKEYLQYLHATRDMYSDYVCMDMKQLDTYLSALIARTKVKTQ
jgi:hypothetical protein